MEGNVIGNLQLIKVIVQPMEMILVIEIAKIVSSIVLGKKVADSNLFLLNDILLA